MSIFKELNLIPLDFQGDYEIRLVYHIWMEESGLTFGTGAQCSRSNAYGHAFIGEEFLNSFIDLLSVHTIHIYIHKWLNKKKSI